MRHLIRSRARTGRLPFDPIPVWTTNAIPVSEGSHLERPYIKLWTDSIVLIDKVAPSERAQAHARFQEIAFAYAILSDPRRRSRYDTTGRMNETLSLDDEDEFNWNDFFRTQFDDVVNTESIEKFKKEYQGSEEEKLAVIEAYVNGEGDMERIYEEVMLSDPLEDEERYRKWIDEEIEARRVEAYPAYAKETRAARKDRMSRAKAERKEAEEYARELGLHAKLFGNGESDKKTKKGEDDMDGLKTLIQQRQKERSKDFLADLEAKYAPKKSKKRKSGEELEEPPEEAFERIAKRAKKSRSGEAVEESAGKAVERKPKRTKRAKA